MNIPALDYLDIVPKTRAKIALGQLLVDPETITGAHAKRALEDGRMQITDFRRRTPVHLIATRDTEDVVAVSATAPVVETAGSERVWRTEDGETYSTSSYKAIPLHDIGIPANYGQRHKPDTVWYYPDMGLNDRLPQAVSPPATTAERVMSIPTQPTANDLPTLFSMKKPEDFENFELLSDYTLYGNRQALIFVSDYLLGLFNFEAQQEFQALLEEGLREQLKPGQYTSAALRQLLHGFQWVKRQGLGEQKPIDHALVIGVNNGFNLSALAFFDGEPVCDIKQITAVRKAKEKGAEEFEQLLGMLARAHHLAGMGEELPADASFETLLDWAFNRRDYVQIVERAPTVASYKEIAAERKFGLVVFDTYEADPNNTRRIIDKIAEHTEPGCLWIMNNWNMPSVRVPFEKAFAEGVLGTCHWQLHLPGYLDDEQGPLADFHGNGVCIAYTNRGHD